MGNLPGILAFCLKTANSPILKTLKSMIKMLALNVLLIQLQF